MGSIGNFISRLVFLYKCNLPGVTKAIRKSYQNIGKHGLPDSFFTQWSLNRSAVGLPKLSCAKIILDFTPKLRKLSAR